MLTPYKSLILPALCLITTNLLGQPNHSNIDVHSKNRDQPSLRVGYVGEHIFNRPLKLAHGGQGRFPQLRRDLRRTFDGIEATWSVPAGYTLFGQVGASKHEITLRESESKRKYRAKPGASFGLGLCAPICELGDVSLDSHVYYQRHTSVINSRYDKIVNYTIGQAVSSIFTRAILGLPYGDDYVKDDLGGQKLRVTDQSIALGLTASYQLQRLTPYVGVQLLTNRVTFKPSGGGTPFEDLETFKNRKCVGAVAGLNLKAGGRYHVNLEGKMLNERAVSLTGQFGF